MLGCAGARRLRHFRPYSGTKLKFRVKRTQQPPRFLTARLPTALQHVPCQALECSKGIWTGERGVTLESWSVGSDICENVDFAVYDGALRHIGSCMCVTSR